MPPKKPRGYPLSSQLLAEYRDAAIVNAGELIAEATTLLAGGHHARAYFIAVAAIEEIGKAVQAAQGLGRNLSDPAVRTRLQNQFEDHSNKVTSAFIPWMLASTDLRSEVMDFVNTAIDLQNGRQPSMYVNINPETLVVITPRAAVPQKAAYNSVALAKAILEQARPFTQATPQTYTREQDMMFALGSKTFIKMSNTADFWEYYIARMESGDKALENAVADYHQKYFVRGVMFKKAPPSAGAAS